MDSWGPLIISGTAFTKTAGVSTSSIHGVSSVATSCGVSLPWSTGLSESLFAFCEAGDFEVTVLQALFERAPSSDSRSHPVPPWTPVASPPRLSSRPSLDPSRREAASPQGTE